MKKKSLITSLVLGAILTLTLGVYTLVTAIIALTTPHHLEVSLAYTSEQKITAFSNYKEENGNLSFTFDDDTNILNYNKEGNYYTLKDGVLDSANTGDSVHFVATATTDKFGSTIKYDVKVYKQGSGNSETDPYLVGNSDGLEAFADKYEEDKTGLDYVKLVNDVDLKDKDFAGIGSVSNPFTGNFDGNGKTVSNMTINIDKDNILEYTGKQTASSTYFVVSAGLFNTTAEATIKGVSLENATINVNADVEEIVSQDTVTVGEDTLKIRAIRLGLVVGSASQTYIDGALAYEEEEVDEEGNVTKVTKYNNSKITGKISGYTYTPVIEGAAAVAGIGGLVGVITDGSTTLPAGAEAYEINNYDVSVDLTSSSTVNEYTLIGGVVGALRGNAANIIEINDVNVTLTSESKFNMQNRIAGIVGDARYASVTNANIDVVVKDNQTTADDFANWIATPSNEFYHLTYVSGVVADARNSSFSDIEVEIQGLVYGRSAGAFVNLFDSSATNVTTSGKLYGYNAEGFAYDVRNSSITYQAEVDTTVAASDVDLTGYFTDGLVGYAENSNILAQGEGTVTVNVVAHPFGSEVTNIDINNTANNAGLVGYFYLTTDATADTEVSGFDVTITVDNGVDMAGLVSYLGTEAGSHVVTLQNNKVNATFASHSTKTYNNASAHKVAGAVDTIYGHAVVNNNEVNVSVNENLNETAYGFAMFGGLVARVAGGNVTLSNNKVSGAAKANNSVYTKTYGTNTFKQITAGGLVGVIAGFGEEVEAGSHPSNVDQINQINVSTITISANIVDVDLTVSYTETDTMKLHGYQARSIGSLIGLVMNSGEGNTSNPYTTINLGGNTVLGTVEADDVTYSYIANGSVYLYSNGYGEYDDEAKREVPYAVGATFDYTAQGGVLADGWNADGILTEIAE